VKHKNPVALIILDGFGVSKETLHNAVLSAKKPNIEKFLSLYPHTNLFASGEYVGLLPGYIGNSQVGHLTIGAGRVITQPVTRIFETIEDKTFFDNNVLVQSLQQLQKKGGSLHIMGMLSDAGVHSHIAHLYAFLLAAKQQGISQVFIHGFLDGRDVAPQSAATYLEQLDAFIKKESIGKLASLHGRFYAMDRDNNWDRTQKSYDVLTGNVKFQGYQHWKELLKDSYNKDITDEFIVPTLLHPERFIKPGDGLIFFNFRPDRARQLTASFVDSHFDVFETKDCALTCFVTPVAYADNLHTNVMFQKQKIKHTLKDVLTAQGKTIFSIAETEKYAHVTYFFDGGVEKKYEHETRVLIKSKVAKDYVALPEMSAEQITETVVASLTSNPKDFYLVNYANCDMVGHSGNFDATVKAVECVDTQMGILYDLLIKKMNGTMYITSDHGNAEQMFDQIVGQSHTAHTCNPVPFIFIKKELENSEMKLPLNQLAQIAPFILQDMGIEVPSEMK